MNPWRVVAEFEKVVAEYAGAPYGVAVDSCTNALFLSLKLYHMRHGAQSIVAPRRTYAGVTHSIKNAGHKLHFVNWDWEGQYRLPPTQIIDSARRFTGLMYKAQTHHCLSFHTAKHLPIGRGGMILLDNEEDCKLLKRMRFDGRREGAVATEDTFDCPGYHMLMEPEQASRGLRLMQYVKDYNDDLPMDDYADLSKHPYFTT